MRVCDVCDVCAPHSLCLHAHPKQNTKHKAQNPRMVFPVNRSRLRSWTETDTSQQTFTTVRTRIAQGRYSPTAFSYEYPDAANLTSHQSQFTIPRCSLRRLLGTATASLHCPAVRIQHSSLDHWNKRRGPGSSRRVSRRSAACLWKPTLPEHCLTLP